MNKRRIATIGVFDGVHLGHRALVSELSQEASRRGLIPTVFTFATHPLALVAPEKTPECLMSLEDRIAELHDAGAEDVIILQFDNILRNLTAAEFISYLHDSYGVEAILMGFNHRFGSDRLSDFKAYRTTGKSLGIDIIQGKEWKGSPDSPAVCSSAIRTLLKDGNVTAAATMLGRNYSIAGTVVSGKQLGRQLGFPTANISPQNDGQLVPACGVYAVDAILHDGSRHRAMLNIGTRPTVDHSDYAPVSIEVHIISWSGDLYGKTVSIEFLKHLRPEMRFSALDELKKQLAADKSNALTVV